MVYYDSDSFLNELTKLLKLSQSKQTGSVLFTYKRYTPHADESVRLLQRTSLQHKNKRAHQNKSNSTINTSNNTQSSNTNNSNHPATHVSIDTEPVLLIHCKYQSTKLVTTVTDKQIKSFIKSLNAIMTVHNTLLDTNEQPPQKARPTPRNPNKQKRTHTDTGAITSTSQSQSNKSTKKQKSTSNTNKNVKSTA